MPITLTLRAPGALPVDVSSLRLDQLCGQDESTAARTVIGIGNRQLPCGEIFHVSGSAAADQLLIFEGDCRNVQGIGTGHAVGRIRVLGSAGVRLGEEMRGGEIVVEGDAGDRVGVQMRSGRIRIQGNAGNRVGAADCGARKGMTGGEILIAGHAGHEIGQAMRRGVIAVGGQAGDAAGASMIAGTILIFGSVGRLPGANMKRGTIGLLSPRQQPELLPTFRYATTERFVAMHLTLRSLQRLGFVVPEPCLSAEFDLYRGDFLELGKGEILTMAG
ncbi:formylmethanofuran dehydrogenase subunit C [Planctomicrobium sp. SH664]|uniref:formylmethanofuran dehydrogenase subunit C n=1 Tax=Planctomicrobium sp. SH664 TaxID=3448125 RepID=UPI003F5B398B